MHPQSYVQIVCTLFLYILNTRLGKCVNDTLNSAFQAKIDGLVEAGAIGNSITYSCSLRHLEKYAGTNIPLDAITVDWLKNMKKQH